MNLIEVLQGLDKLPQDERTSVWFRPIRWRKARFALTIDERNFRRILAVPGAHDGDRALFPDFDDAIGEWEIVTPEQVLNGE